MDQPLLPGIEEADLANGLGFLHGTKITVVHYAKGVVLDWNEIEHRYVERTEPRKNVKNKVDNRE